MVGGLHGTGAYRQDFAYVQRLLQAMSLPLLQQIRQQMETVTGHSLHKVSYL